MLNLQETAERASKYRHYAGYGLWVAWGFTGAAGLMLAATAWSYHVNNLPIRVDVIVASVVIITAPAIVGWWVYELLRGVSLRASNRALRMTNRSLQEQVDTAEALKCPDPTCRHCATVKLNSRADKLMAEWDAKHPRADAGS